MTIYSVDGDVRLTLAPDPGYFCIFYVLIPFMMIFSCVEYPILGVRGKVDGVLLIAFHVYPSLLFSLFCISHLYRVPG